MTVSTIFPREGGKSDSSSSIDYDNGQIDTSLDGFLY